MKPASILATIALAAVASHAAISDAPLTAEPPVAPISSTTSWPPTMESRPSSGMMTGDVGSGTHALELGRAKAGVHVVRERLQLRIIPTPRDRGFSCLRGQPRLR